MEYVNIIKEKGILEVMRFNLLNSEFYLRFLSAFILFITLILFFFLGELFIKIALFFLTFFLFNELEQLFSGRKKHFIYLSLLVFLYLFLPLKNFETLFFIDFFYIFFFLNFLLIFILFFQLKNLHYLTVAWLINLTIFSFIHLLEGSKTFVFLLIILISSNDIMAYIGGKLFGKKKIFPIISPNKTLEGSLVGLFSSIFISVSYAFISQLDIISYFLLGFCVGVFGTLGDLYISFFKRKINIKDSGNLIPGHGGVLDRFDSYLFCLPICAIILDFLL